MKAPGRLLGAFVPFVLVAGCGGPSASTAVTTDAGALPPPDAAALVTLDAPLRRPTRRYYFERTETQCEAYSVDDAQKTPPEAFACPPDLLIGERLRLVGKTCTRESPESERREPTVCPDPLTNLEKRDLARDHSL